VFKLEPVECSLLDSLVFHDINSEETSVDRVSARRLKRVECFAHSVIWSARDKSVMNELCTRMYFWKNNFDLIRKGVFYCAGNLHVFLRIEPWILAVVDFKDSDIVRRPSAAFIWPPSKSIDHLSSGWYEIQETELVSWTLRLLENWPLHTSCGWKCVESNQRKMNLKWGGWVGGH
jgi:hypothetical protein